MQPADNTFTALREQAIACVAAIVTEYDKIPEKCTDPLLSEIYGAVARKFAKHMATWNKIHSQISEVESLPARCAEIRRAAAERNRVTGGIDYTAITRELWNDICHAEKSATDAKCAIESSVASLIAAKETFETILNTIESLEANIRDMKARIYDCDVVDAKLAVGFAQWICEELRYINENLDCNRDMLTEYARNTWAKVEAALGSANPDRAVIGVSRPYSRPRPRPPSGCCDNHMTSVCGISTTLTPPDIPTSHAFVAVAMGDNVPDGFGCVYSIGSDEVPPVIRAAVADMTQRLHHNCGERQGFVHYDGVVVGFNSSKAK